MIAFLIGAPIDTPTLHLIGFRSPVPVPDTRPRSGVTFSRSSFQDLHLQRSVTRASRRATAGAGR